MSDILSNKEIEKISFYKNGKKNQYYTSEDGILYIGERDGTLKRITGAKKIPFNPQNKIKKSNVEDAIKEILRIWPVVYKTEAEWLVDTEVYSEKLLFSTDQFYSTTDQQKFKITNGTDTWSNLDYFPIGVISAVISVTDDGNMVVEVDNTDPNNPVILFNGINITGARVSGDGTSGNPLTVDFSGILTDTLNDGKILIGNASNVATEVTPSGNALISNTGVITLADEFQLAVVSTFRFLTKN